MESSAAESLTQPPPPPPARGRKRRRAAKLLGLAFVLGVLFLLLAPFVAWAWLTSSSGGSFVRQQAEQVAGELLQGRVEIEGVRLRGLLRVELEGVRLFAPDEQEPVASIGRLVADARVLSLLSNRIDLYELRVESPRLRFVPGVGGSNLQRALAMKDVPEEPSQTTPPAPSSSPRFDVVAPDLEIVDGAAFIGGETPIELSGLALTAAVQGALDDLGGEAKLAASLKQPVVREVSLDLEGRFAAGAVEFERLIVESGGSKVSLSGVARRDLSSASLKLLEVRADPSDVKAFAPEVELLGPVSATGLVTLEGVDASAKLDLQLPAGEVTLDARAGLDFEGAEPITSWSGTLSLTDVELHKLLKTLPESFLGGTLEVREGRGLPGRGTARVSFVSQRLRYEKLPVERLNLEGSLEGLKLRVSRLDAKTAGAEVRARGTVEAERGRVQASLEVPSAAATRRALVKGLGLALPELSGAASLDVTVDGAWKDPAIQITGRVPHFEAEGAKAKALTLTASLSRLGPDPRISGALEADELSYDRLEGRQLRAAVGIDGRTVKAAVDGQLSGTRVDLRVNGRREPSKTGVQKWKIDELRGRALGLSMSADGPAIVELAGSRVSVDRLALRGDLGRLALSGRGGATGPLDAHLTLDGVRLDRIPKELLPPELLFGGVLSGSISASGTAENPTADAKLAIANGRWDAFGPVEAQLDARLHEQRILASLQARLPESARLSATADVPLLAPVEAASLKTSPPVSASITFEKVTPDLARAFVTDLPELGGALQGSATLTGTWADPTARMRLIATGARGFGVEALDAKLEADWDDGLLSTKLGVQRGTFLDADATARVNLASGELLAGRLPDWRTLPVDGEVRLTRLSLPWLTELKFLPPRTTGVASGRVLLSGTSEAPEISATLAMRDASFAEWSDVDATADVRLREQLELTLGADVEGAPLVSLALRSPVAAAKLVTMKPDDVWTLPLTAEAKLLPTPLERLVPPEPGEDRQIATGSVSGRVQLSGTPEAPRLRIDALVEKLATTTGLPLGRLVVEGSHDGSRTSATARFDSVKNGTLDARLLVPGGLSGRALTTDIGVEAVLSRRAEVSLFTKDFDLALADGFVAGVREIGGKLDLDVRKKGPLLEPGGQGSLKVRKARAAIVDFGELADLELDASVAWPAFEISRLSGRSGEGRFNGRGDLGSVDGGQSFKGAFHLDVNQLPLVQHYETKGWLTLGVDAQVAFEKGLVTVSPLKLANGLLKIADTNVTKTLTGQGKDIQNLDPHPEIAFKSEVEAKLRREARRVARAIDEDRSPPTRYDVRLTVPNDFVVEAPLGTKLVMGANLKVTYDPARAVKDLDPLDIEGRVNVVQGNVNVLRRFDVKKGQLTFRAGQWAAPDLDIEARHEGSDGTVVTVAVGGTAENPTPRYHLQPKGNERPVTDEAEVIFYLTTGRRQTRANEQTPDLSEALKDGAVQAFGSLAGSLVKSIGRKWSVSAALMPDELSIDTSLTGDSPGIERVKAGKYFTSRIYIGGQVNPTANVEQGESLFQVEGSYQLSDESALRLNGAQGSFGAEITYEKDFPTAEQRKSRQRK